MKKDREPDRDRKRDGGQEKKKEKKIMRIACLVIVLVQLKGNIQYNYDEEDE